MAYARSTIDGFGNHDRRLYHEVTNDELLGPRLKIMSEDRETGEDLQVEHEALHLTAEDAETIAAGYALLANALRDGEAAPMLALDGADAERCLVAMRNVFADAGRAWAGSVLQRLAEAVAPHDGGLRDRFAALADEVFALNAKAEDLQDAREPVMAATGGE